MAAIITPLRSKYLPFPRIESIRSRILVFAVLAALVPSGIMLGIFYTQNRHALEKKITEDLLSESSQSARATGVWLKERLYDLRVFSGSDEVTNSLDQAARSNPASPAQGRVRDYLISLHERFSDFEQLMVFDLDGKFIRQWPVPEWKGFSFRYPDAVFDERSGRLYVTSSGTNEVLAFDLEGTPQTGIKPSPDKALDNPSALAVTTVNKKTQLLVLNTNGSRVSAFELENAKSK